MRFLLGSEQIRDPAPYNAISGRDCRRRNKIQWHDLGWIRREFPFGEHSERRASYRVADHFLTFWYRFFAPLASNLQFSDPASVYASHVAPRLADYMGWSVFEEICGQWLQRNASSVSA